MLTNMKSLLAIAEARNCAIPAFNAYNGETTMGIIKAAEEAKQQENKVINAATDIPKSFIVCNWGMDVVVYISQISAQTLLKRCNYVKKISYI